MIEPLSIYSNNSPPVEINDESIGGDNDGTGPSHHGILHMPSINERRISEEGSHQSRITQTLNLQLLHIPREKRKMKMTTSLTPHPEFGSIWDQAQPLEVTLTADIVATVLLEEPYLNA